MVRWICAECGLNLQYEGSHCPNGHGDTRKVKLTGTYRRRKPEPEVWEGPTKRSVSGDVAIIQLSSEWIDKRVKVEVVE